MKKLEWLTWQVVILLLGVLFAVLIIFIAVPVWLIVTGRAPASLLIAPIGTILGAVASGVVFWTKGKYEIPPYLDDPNVQKLIRSTSPPPAEFGELDIDELLPVTKSARPPHDPPP